MNLKKLMDSHKVSDYTRRRRQPQWDPRDFEVDENDPQRKEWAATLRWEIVDDRNDEQVELVDELTGVNAYRLSNEELVNILKLYNLVDQDAPTSNFIVEPTPSREEIYILDKTTDIEYTIGELKD
jgi:hypothetical protein